jgi:hypothetical protein
MHSARSWSSTASSLVCVRFSGIACFLGDLADVPGGSPSAAKVRTGAPPHRACRLRTPRDSREPFLACQNPGPLDPGQRKRGRRNRGCGFHPLEADGTRVAITRREQPAPLTNPPLRVARVRGVQYSFANPRVDPVTARCQPRSRSPNSPRRPRRPMNPRTRSRPANSSPGWAPTPTADSPRGKPLPGAAGRARPGCPPGDRGLVPAPVERRHPAVRPVGVRDRRANRVGVGLAPRPGRDPGDRD